MINDYEEEMIDEMWKIEQYTTHCCFVNEEGFSYIDDDFLKALEYCINFMYNFIDIINIEANSIEEEDLNFKLIMAKIEYYQKIKELCESEKE